MTKTKTHTKGQGKPELPRLTESEARQNMKGAYITLADGRTHYVEHLSERDRQAFAKGQATPEVTKNMTRNWKRGLAINEVGAGTVGQDRESYSPYEVKETCKAYEEQIRKLTAQRDELLAALKAVANSSRLSIDYDANRTPDVLAIREIVWNAIAKAEGK